MIKKIDWVGYFFISIFGIPFLLFNIFPILFGAYISFNEWGIFGEPDWIGLENYTNLFVDKYAYIAFKSIICINNCTICNYFRIFCSIICK